MLVCGEGVRVHIPGRDPKPFAVLCLFLLTIFPVGMMGMVLLALVRP